jgi:hypothetical protein
MGHNECPRCPCALPQRSAHSLIFRINSRYIEWRFVDGFLAAIACANGASGARVWPIPGVNASRARIPARSLLTPRCCSPATVEPFLVLPAFAAPWRNGKLVPVK